MKHFKQFAQFEQESKPIAYSEYLAENIDNVIAYTEYVAENLDKAKDYSMYVAENLDRHISHGIPGKSGLSGVSGISGTSGPSGSSGNSGFSSGSSSIAGGTFNSGTWINEYAKEHVDQPKELPILEDFEVIEDKTYLNNKNWLFENSFTYLLNE